MPLLLHPWIQIKCRIGRKVTAISKKELQILAMAVANAGKSPGLQSLNPF